MKKCNICNLIASDDIKYCSNCGSNDFEKINTQENNMSREVYDYTESSVNSDISNNRKKKMFAMLGVLAIVLVALVAFTAIKITIDSKAKNDSQNNKHIQREEVAFSLGEISGNKYRNEWADIQFVLDNNWKQAPKENYSFFEDENATCDFNALSDDNSQITVLLIDLSSKESLLLLSEDDLVKEYSKGISKKLDEPKTSEIQYQMLGNQVYLYSDVSGKANDNEICITSFLRKKNDYAIIINVSSVNAEKNHKTSEKIESCG